MTHALEPAGGRVRHALEPLMEHHQRLDALFLAHQEALVGLEVERAQEGLRVYREALFAHMRFEETRILPGYEKLPRVRGGGVEFFLGEHEKLRALLGEVAAIVEPLGPGSERLRARIVEAFDRAALFKSLLEHHDVREGQLLYPRLAEVLSAEEARELLAAAPIPP